jgi:hypothetical protein
MDKNKTGLKLGGNYYEIEVNAYTIEEVRKNFDLDLLACFEDKTVIEKIGQPATFINVLRVLMDDSCERHETTDDRSFARLFKDGDTLDEAAECFQNALLAFFPSRQRTPLRKLMQMEREAEARIRAKQDELIDSDKMDKLIDLQLDALERKFSSALESLESEILEDGR